MEVIEGVLTRVELLIVIFESPLLLLLLETIFELPFIVELVKVITLGPSLL